MAKVLRRPDMQRTVRVFRIALPVAFLAFVIVLVASWNRNAGGKRQDGTEPVTSTLRPEKPIGEAIAFEDVQTIGGRVVSRIRARRVVPFESGWTTLEGVHLTIYRPNALTYELVCPQAQFNSETKEADAKGGVKLTSSDGVEISTSEIKFDGNRLTNDIPVQFKVDRWNGNAGALDLDVAAETLRLHRKVTATMIALQPAELPMTVKGDESVFRRGENTVTFSNAVEMDRGPDRLRSDWIIGRFTQDRRQLIGIEGNGHCNIVLAANTVPGEDFGGRKEIRSDGFFTEMGPNGEIVAINARSAENPAEAILDGPPKREIRARGFRVALANKIVSEMRADFSVVMNELGPMPREINAEHVIVNFDPATRRARSAYLEGAFRYKDPRTTASAFRANYDITGDRIVLTTDPGWQATVVSDGHTLKAKQIEFSPRAQTAKATGSVIAELVSKGKGPTADSTNLFPSGKPVFVNADELFMRQAQKIAHFTGNVKAWQEQNTLLAAEMQVQGSGDAVTARGNVRTLLYNTGETARKSPVQSTSEQLVAKRAENRVDLVGKVVIVDESRTLKSERASFHFDGNRKIQRIEAETSVQLAELPTQRKGSADKAIYHVDKKMIHLYGKPATISDPSGSVDGEQIQFDLVRNKVQVISPTGKTKGTYKHEGS
jgi:lipopolysaccharide transport protein LptA